MLSERHYAHRTLKMLESRWLGIKHPEVAAKYSKAALAHDKDGNFCLAVLATINTLFNASLCLFVPEQEL